jgi:hypothetical protein
MDIKKKITSRWKMEMKIKKGEMCEKEEAVMMKKEDKENIIACGPLAG